MTTDPRYSGWRLPRYWPVPPGPPRLPDGTIDIRALCRQWDDEMNAGLEPPARP